MKNYETAKALYLQGKSLRTIELELGINRKLLSKKLKADNIIVTKGIKDQDYIKACELYKTGKSLTSIAKELKLDKHTLSRKMETDGIRKPIKRHDRSTKHDAAILEAYNNNISIEKIAKSLNISTNMVWNCLKSHLVDTNKEYRTYSINKDVFKKIDTEEKAYWLGLLYADGYVDNDRGVELSLKQEDIAHVEKFKQFLETDAPIKDKTINLNCKSFRAARLSIGCKSLAEDLVKLGCFKNKSLSLKFPTEEQVPKHLIHHFMRGYFDGDGSIHASTPAKGNGTKLQRVVQIVGTKEFLDEYMKHLYDIGITKTKYQRHGKAFGVSHGGNNKVQKIYDFLYKDATVYLDRKYTKFNCRLKPKLQKA